MQELTIQDFVAMWERALVRVTERTDEFSKLDAVIGDGDHGTAIVQALTSLVEAARKGTELKTMLNDMGFNVMMQTSGSTSTLIGGFLLGMGDHAEGTGLNAGQVKQMFKGGLEGVRKQTQARKGDKTMMDALIPAVEAILSCESEDIRRMLSEAAKAAKAGAEATVEMKANFGRARNYGEKSVGHADSGASSWACMFQAFAEQTEK
ncbi:MAG: dihydroxyacetone kinase subunit L [Dysgonamonadaceae bacterium]|jgi:dihydroxyacetone kinase-like protein|nr:dihydroxyacetone kinase subunit L [Dysgonamonadaceae bacterium]